MDKFRQVPLVEVQEDHQHQLTGMYLIPQDVKKSKEMQNLMLVCSEKAQIHPGRIMEFRLVQIVKNGPMVL